MNIEELQETIDNIQNISSKIAGLANAYISKIFGEIDLTTGQKQALLAKYNALKDDLVSEVSELP